MNETVAGLLNELLPGQLLIGCSFRLIVRLGWLVGWLVGLPAACFFPSVFHEFCLGSNAASHGRIRQRKSQGNRMMVTVFLMLLLLLLLLPSA